MEALTCALAALLLAGAPGHQLPTAVQDDALLLNRSPAPVQQYLGQMRGTHGPQLVHVERRDPGTSAWVPVSVPAKGVTRAPSSPPSRPVRSCGSLPTTGTRPTA